MINSRLRVLNFFFKGTKRDFDATNEISIFLDTDLVQTHTPYVNGDASEKPRKYTNSLTS